MADLLARAPALDAARLARGLNREPFIGVVEAEAKFIFRGDAKSAKLASEAIGVEFLQIPCRSSMRDGIATMWLGPDEWLLVASETQGASIQNTLESALASTPHALIGVSHRNVALTVSGLNAARVINAGCPLDLDESAFPVGMCTRTVLAKAQIIVRRTGATCFYLSTWRSFTPYVWDFLVEARTGL